MILSNDDAFFKEMSTSGGGNEGASTQEVPKAATMEEYFRRYDERVNAKIASGLKRGFKLIVDQLNGLVDNQVNGQIDEKLSLKIRNFT